MPAFKVDKVYYIPHRDLIVLAGRSESGIPQAGMQIDLPREIRGPGWVPIHDVQKIPFADGTEKLGIILLYDVVTSAQLMEFSDLEGLALDVRR